MENNPSSSRIERKFRERNRRNHMKALYFKLNSIVPHQSSREAKSLPDQIGEATNYIKSLQMKLEKMKEKKNNLLGTESLKDVSMNRGIVKGSKFPRFEIKEVGSTFEVVLITGLDSQFVFSDTIRFLREEGSDIVYASYTVVDNAVFHTIYCQLGESANGAARISEKLKKFLYHSSSF